jgi:hypothetical protein
MTTGNRSSDASSLFTATIITGLSSIVIIMVLVLSSWYNYQEGRLKAEVISVEIERDRYKRKFEECKNQLGVFYHPPKGDNP